MEEFIIEYHFGVKDKIFRLVRSLNDDPKLVLMTNMSGEGTSFTDINGYYCSFDYSQVKYIRVYPYSQLT